MNHIDNGSPSSSNEIQRNERVVSIRSSSNRSNNVATTTNDEIAMYTSRNSNMEQSTPNSYRVSPYDTIISETLLDDDQTIDAAVVEAILEDNTPPVIQQISPAAAASSSSHHPNDTRPNRITTNISAEALLIPLAISNQDHIPEVQPEVDIEEVHVQQHDRNAMSTISALTTNTTSIDQRDTKQPPSSTPRVAAAIVNEEDEQRQLPNHLLPYPPIHPPYPAVLSSSPFAVLPPPPMPQRHTLVSNVRGYSTTTTSTTTSPSIPMFQSTTMMMRHSSSDHTPHSSSNESRRRSQHLVEDLPDYKDQARSILPHRIPMNTRNDSGGGSDTNTPNSNTQNSSGGGGASIHHYNNSSNGGQNSQSHPNDDDEHIPVVAAILVPAERLAAEERLEEQWMQQQQQQQQQNQNRYTYTEGGIEQHRYQHSHSNLSSAESTLTTSQSSNSNSNNNINHNNSNNNNTTTQSGESHLVTSHSQRSKEENSDNNNINSMSERRFWMTIILTALILNSMLVAGAVVGGFCAAGKCSTSSSSNGNQDDVVVVVPPILEVNNTTTNVPVPVVVPSLIPSFSPSPSGTRLLSAIPTILNPDATIDGVPAVPLPGDNVAVVPPTFESVVDTPYPTVTDLSTPVAIGEFPTLFPTTSIYISPVDEGVSNNFTDGTAETTPPEDADDTFLTDSTETPKTVPDDGKTVVVGTLSPTITPSMINVTGDNNNFGNESVGITKESNKGIRFVVLIPILVGMELMIVLGLVIFYRRWKYQRQKQLSIRDNNDTAPSSPATNHTSTSSSSSEEQMVPPESSPIIRTSSMIDNDRYMDSRGSVRLQISPLSTIVESSVLFEV